MVDVTPSALLLEPNAPMWAQRLVLRLVKTFLNLFPTAPVRLWKVPTSADLPDPAAWTGSVAYTADGTVYVSNGTAWLAVGPGASGVPEAPNDGSYYSRRNLTWAVPPAPPPTTTAVTQPTADSSTLIATDSFVHNFGPNLASVTFYGASATLPVGGTGRLHVFNAAGVTLTMPLGSLLWPGATFWIQNATAGALNIDMGVGDAVYRIAGYVTTLALASGKGVALMRSGLTDWYTWGDVL